MTFVQFKVGPIIIAISFKSVHSFMSISGRVHLALTNVPSNTARGNNLGILAKEALNPKGPCGYIVYTWGQKYNNISIPLGHQYIP